jgi:hypothetical protein
VVAVYYAFIGTPINNINNNQPLRSYMTFTKAQKQFEEIYQFLADKGMLRPSYIASLSAVKSMLKTAALGEQPKGESK